MQEVVGDNAERSDMVIWLGSARDGRKPDEQSGEAQHHRQGREEDGRLGRLVRWLVPMGGGGV